MQAGAATQQHPALEEIKARGAQDLPVMSCQRDHGTATAAPLGELPSQRGSSPVRSLLCQKGENLAKAGTKTWHSSSAEMAPRETATGAGIVPECFVGGPETSWEVFPSVQPTCSFKLQVL